LAYSVSYAYTPSQQCEVIKAVILGEYVFGLDGGSQRGEMDVCFF